MVLVRVVKVTVTSGFMEAVSGFVAKAASKGMTGSVAPRTVGKLQKCLKRASFSTI